MFKHDLILMILKDTCNLIELISLQSLGHVYIYKKISNPTWLITHSKIQFLNYMDQFGSMQNNTILYFLRKELK